MKIILHVGNGKTGTTSIQDSLIASRAALAEQGIAFLGFMLDRAPVQAAPWQRRFLNPNVSMNAFLALEPDVARAQVLDAMRRNLAALGEQGVHTVIWSNERFFNHPRLFAEPMQQLIADGHDVEVIAYVRRHDAWAKSVHNQWHLKRKRNEGPNLSFREFAETYKVAYAPALNGWDAAFGDKLVLRNFDAAANVVDDFCAVTGLPRDLLVESRSNDTPGPEETVLRVVFNDRIGVWDPSVDPTGFDRLVSPKDLDLTTNPVALTNDLLPSDDDLRAVLERTAEDRAQVDALLEARGEPPLSTAPKPVRPVEIDGERMDSILFQMLIRQARELKELKEQVERLTQAAVPAEPTA